MSIARVVVGLVGIIAAAASAAEYQVSSADEIRGLNEKLRPGDVVVMRDGAWTDQAITFDAKGTAEAPITLRAQTPGKVVLSGTSTITIDGEHLVVSGLLLKEGRGEKEGIAIKGNNCRFTDTAIIDCTYKFYVRL